MDGPAVFKFAVRVLSEVAIECCEAAEISPNSIDWLIPHQANIRIIESTAKKLGLDMNKVIVTVDRHGNTSAASIPLALDTAVRDGRIQRGHKVLLEGVGGGSLGALFCSNSKRTIYGIRFVFPGQGSQSVGMMAAYGDSSIIRSTFDEASATLGQDLWQLLQTAPQSYWHKQ